MTQLPCPPPVPMRLSIWRRLLRIMLILFFMLLFAAMIIPYGIRPNPTTHTGLTLEAIQSLSELVTVRARLADVVESTVAGRLGSTRAAIVIKGEILIGTDLSAARFSSINPAARTATLLLPQPRPISVKIDHEGSHTFHAYDTGAWAITPGSSSAQAVDLGYKDAQQLLAAAGSDPDLLARARQQAEITISQFAESTGWRVDVAWDP